MGPRRLGGAGGVLLFPSRKRTVEFYTEFVIVSLYLMLLLLQYYEACVVICNEGYFGSHIGSRFECYICLECMDNNAVTINQ